MNKSLFVAEKALVSDCALFGVNELPSYLLDDFLL